MRIEISYHANDLAAEQKFFDPNFERDAKKDIDWTKFHLDQYSKLVFKVNLRELLEAFEEGAKPRQLFVLQPNMCTLIYAKNPKQSNYTGFLYNIPAKTSFDYEKFLLKHALPGPGSNIHCILEPQG